MRRPPPTPFQFTVSAPRGQARAVRAEVVELAAELRGALPEAHAVVVSTCGGVSVQDEAGESLDLHGVPWAWCERALAVFGMGVFVLPGESGWGTPVQEPYDAR